MLGMTRTFEIWLGAPGAPKSNFPSFARANDPWIREPLHATGEIPGREVSCSMWALRPGVTHASILAYTDCG